MKAQARPVVDEKKCYEIILNYMCNASCVFCSQDPAWRHPSSDIPFDKTVGHVYAAYQEGYRKLGLTGGEPTLRKDLVKIMAVAKKVGFGYIRLQTNGIRLADLRYTESLVREGLTLVKFSIHGADAKTHNSLVGVRGAFEKALEAMNHLRRLKVRIGVNILLNKSNYRQLESFTRLFLLKLGVSDFVFIYPLYEGEMARNARKIGVPISEVVPYMRKAFRVFERENFPNPPLLLHFAPCFLPGYEQSMLGWTSFNTIVVHPDSQVTELDAVVDQGKVKPGVCKACVYFKRCRGLEKSYVEIFGASEIKPLTKVPARAGVGKREESGRRILTDNERCVLEVLKLKNRMTTREMLNQAENLPLCKDCRDDNAVIVAAEALVRMGSVKRKFVKGSYVWRLAKK